MHFDKRLNKTSRLEQIEQLNILFIFFKWSNLLDLDCISCTFVQDDWLICAELREGKKRQHSKYYELEKYRLHEHLKIECKTEMESD